MACKKTVLLLGNFHSSSKGSRGVSEDLALRLDTLGWTVTSASSRQNRFMRLVDMIFAAIRHRAVYNVACLEVYSGNAFIWTEVCSLLLGILRKPTVLSLHGGNLPRFAVQWPSRVNRMLRSATVVTTPSNYLQQAFLANRKDIVLLPNALDLSEYTFLHRAYPQPRVAWLRAFHDIYSPSTAVEALALLIGDFQGIELTMFGPDKRDGSLQTMREIAQHLGVSDRLHTPGAIPKSEVPEKLALFDIFINTTTAESFGVSVMEAAALGMCIVTTNVGELPYIWTHEHDALLVPPNDPHAMADAIRRILTEPGLAERLSRNAREKAEQFDWSVILPQWEELLLDVIGRHQGE